MHFFRVILLASKFETKLLLILILLVGISPQLIYFTLRSLVMLLFRCGISVNSDRCVCVEEAALFHVKVNEEGGGDYTLPHCWQFFVSIILIHPYPSTNDKDTSRLPEQEEHDAEISHGEEEDKEIGTDSNDEGVAAAHGMYVNVH